jgi:hypothetical protein
VWLFDPVKFCVDSISDTIFAVGIITWRGTSKIVSYMLSTQNFKGSKSHTSVTPPGDYTYSKESHLCYSSRWLYLQQRVTPLLLHQVIILTTKSHTSVTPPGDYTYNKESDLRYSSMWLYLQQRVTPLLLLQVIILTAKSRTSVTPPGDYTYKKESHLCYSSRWLYLQQTVTPRVTEVWLFAVSVVTWRSNRGVTLCCRYNHLEE